MGLVRAAASIALVAALPTLLNVLLLYPGLPVHSGTYTYVLEIRNGNSTQLQSGHVTLLR